MKLPPRLISIAFKAAVWLCVCDILSIASRTLYWSFYWEAYAPRLLNIDGLRILTALSIIGSIRIARKRGWWTFLAVVMALNIVSYFVTADINAAFYSQTGPGSSFQMFPQEYIPKYLSAGIVTVGLLLLWIGCIYATVRSIRSWSTRPA